MSGHRYGTRSRTLLKDVEREVTGESEELRTRTVQYRMTTKSDEELQREDDGTRDNAWGIQWIQQLFTNAVEYVKQSEGLDPRDQVGFQIDGGDLDYPIVIPLRQYHSPEFQSRMLVSAVEGIQQSKKEWTMGCSLDLSVTVVRNVSAQGKTGTKRLSRTKLTTVMTPELLYQGIRDGVFQMMFPPDHPQDLIRDMLKIVSLYEQERSGAIYTPEEMQLRLFADKEVESWEMVIGRWCSLHEGNENVMVIYQPASGMQHAVRWSNATDSTTKFPRVIWWDRMETRLLRVVTPDWMYGKDQQRMCSRCGVMQKKSSTAHACMASHPELAATNRRKRPHFLCTKDQKQRKRTKVTYEEFDESKNCLGRALFHALIRAGSEVIMEDQHKPLYDWHVEMGMDDLWDQPCGLSEVRRWAEAINEGYGCATKCFELCVYNEEKKHMMANFGRKQGEGIEVVCIYLNLMDDHFTLIESMAPWIGRSYFCDYCKKGYSDKRQHKCVLSCMRCGCQGNNHYTGNTNVHVKCEECNRTFWNDVCFRAHKLRQLKGSVSFTTCERTYRCQTCGVTVDRLQSKNVRHPKTMRKQWVWFLASRQEHVCFVYDCTVCGKKKVTRGEHQCYIRGVGEVKEPNKKKDRPMHLAFFDFETQCLEDHHVVNKVVVLKCCHVCAHSIKDYETQGCSGLCGRQRLSSFSTTVEFMSWLLNTENLVRHRKYTFLAHNLKGYDSYPILEYCLKNSITPSCIFQGAKILSMTINGIVFKDSLCFIPLRLEDFPKTFGTESGEKGFFPHFFNTRANAGYVGVFPPLETYGIDDMSEEKQRRLREWWHEQEGKTFDLEKELHKYCVQDVLVMTYGCLAFRNLYVELFGVCPFSECLTIASTCLNVFKRNFLKPEVMGVVPPLGYRQHDVCSTQANEWLYSLGVEGLEWAGGTQGEATVTLEDGSRVKVDGLDRQRRVVYQFHGCYWHACPVCFPNRGMIHTHLGITMTDIYDKTIKMTRALMKAGWQVIEMWSHTWDELREYEPTFPDWIRCGEPLRPREGMYGGRTNAISLYARTKDAEELGDDASEEERDAHNALLLMSTPVDKIRYIDVCSLYPSVMYLNEYPVGHPKVLFGEMLEDVEMCARKITSEEWFGMVKCDVNLPKGLFFPVLPQVINHKLVFTLCHACVLEHGEEGENDRVVCAHTEEERRISCGVWTSVELREALKRGYTLHRVHEVWQYEKKDGELFKSYICENLKLKLQASGWPRSCTTDETKQAFLDKVKQEQDIDLEWDAMEYNPGMRCIAKLDLNSLWGKLCQNPFRTKTVFLKKAAEYFELLNDPTIEVLRVLLFDDLAQVTYNVYRECVPSQANGNVVVGAFVTSYARLKLLTTMEKLGSRTLYHDTDSIIYTTTGDEEEIELGNNLGEWEDECKDPKSDWLTEFVSLGPKTYAYRTKKGAFVVKCKGISLDQRTKKKVHMNSMKRLLVNSKEKLIVKYPRRIVRDTYEKKLRTVEMTKDFRMVYTKRVMQEDGLSTLPYGY